MATALYHLHPHGVGGRSVESFTSWVRRLAFRHVVSIGRLLHSYVLTPLVTNTRRHQLFDAGRVGESINARPQLTQLLVERLSELTGVSGLERTTLLGLPRELLRATDFRRFRAWCPRCLACLEQEAYDRLTWTFVDTRVCPDCGTALVDRCASCGRQHTPWAVQATPTRCPWCAQLLAGPTSPAEPDAVADALAEIVSFVQRGVGVDASSVREGMFLVASDLGGASVLARQLDIPPRQLRDALAGRTSMPITLVARVAAVSQRSIDRLALGGTPVQFVARGRGRGISKLRPVLVTDALERELRRADTVRALSRLARDNHWSVATMKLVAPEQSARLIERHAREQRESAERRRREDEVRIRQVVVARRVAGLAISRTAVATEIGRPWIFAEHWAKQLYAEALNDT